MFHLHGQENLQELSCHQFIWKTITAWVYRLLLQLQWFYCSSSWDHHVYIPSSSVIWKLASVITISETTLWSVNLTLVFADSSRVTNHSLWPVMWLEQPISKYHNLSFHIGGNYEQNLIIIWVIPLCGGPSNFPCFDFLPAVQNWILHYRKRFFVSGRMGE